MHRHDIIAQLRERGVRLTPQRQAILEYLFSTDSHPRADEIHQHVRRQFPGISLATVYNNLNVLKKKGLVLELNYGDVASRYDGRTDAHSHITCRECGRVIDFVQPDLDHFADQVSGRTGYRVDQLRVEVVGLCPDCGGRPAGASEVAAAHLGDSTER